MFDSSSSGYRRFGGRSGAPLSRNVTFFVILIVLVVFVSLFYLYLSASSELTRLRQECDSQGDYVLKLKNELLETNVNVEKLRASETECTNAKSSLNTKYEECNTETDKRKQQIDEYLKMNGEHEDVVSSLKKQIQNFTTIIEEQTVNISAMEKVGINQQALIISLNETVELLRRDLALKDSLVSKQKEVAPLLGGANISAAVGSSAVGVQNATATTTTDSPSGVLGDNQQKDDAATTTTLSANLEKMLAAGTTTSSSASAPNAFHDSPVDPKPGARVELEEKKDGEEAKDKEHHEQLVEAAQQNADEDAAKEEKDDFVDDKP